MREKVVLFYRGRGNAENFIREGKNGFDLHHFPCLKLVANKAYVVDRLKVYRIRSFRCFFGWTVLLVKAFGASLQNHMVGYC